MTVTDNATVLRYAFSQGAGRDFVAPLAPGDRPLTTTFGTLPARVGSDRMQRLSWGTADLLEDSAYPLACLGSGLTPMEQLHHALVMAFGLQRREPSNLFNDHRATASVRSRFPVHTFVQAGSEAWLLDVYRHGLLPVGDAAPEVPGDWPLQVVLAGRYTHLPSLYGRLRGPLVELELGMALRSLGVALEVFALAGEAALPLAEAPASGVAPVAAALEPPGEWTVPLVVDVSPAGSTVPSRRQRPAPTAPPAAATSPPAPAHPAATSPPAPARPAATSPSAPGHPAATSPPGPARPAAGDDPTLAEAVAVNRAGLETARTAGGAHVRGTAVAVPAALAASQQSWGEVLWQRSAGHMPSRLAGFSGRRRRLPTETVTDAAAWAALPPPTPLLAEIARRITISVCVQDVDGFPTGWYRLRRDDHDDAVLPGTTPSLDQLRADPSLPQRLEGCYGHGLGPEVGCAVRHATMTWILTADVAALVADFGAGGWTLAQIACGWIVHGLCLSAAAHRLYARPTRAFDELLLHPAVGTSPGEMVLLSVVSGPGRYLDASLDLRT
jgi:hypothetical protein